MAGRTFLAVVLAGLVIAAGGPVFALSGKFSAALRGFDQSDRHCKDPWVVSPDILPEPAVLARWGLSQRDWYELDDPELLTRLRFRQRRSAFVAAAAAHDPVAAYVTAYDKLDRAEPTASGYRTALLPMTAAAEAGNLRAMHYLWDFYLHGPEDNRNEASANRWAERAAAAGSPMAMEGMVGLELELWVNRERVPTTRLRTLMRRAAEAGSCNAMLGHAGILQTFDRSPAANTEAVAWLERAARSGSAPAFLALAQVYIEGRGVTIDFDTAMGHLQAARLLEPEMAEEFGIDALLDMYARLRDAQDRTLADPGS